MVEPTVTVPGVWAVGAAGLLAVLALYAACLDGVLTGGGDGARRGSAAIPLVEVARLMRQRRRTLVAADRLLWRIGGAGLIVVALLMVTVVPLGRWTLFDLDVGVAWFNAMDVMVWGLVWLAGWGANSAYALVGGYRFLAHGLGYELLLMFAVVAPAVAAGSLRVGDVAAAQSGLWYAVWMPVAFVVYSLGVVAFSLWGPFAPALGADIVGGVTAELSGVDRLVFLAGRYALLAAGPRSPCRFFSAAGRALVAGWLWVLAKTVALLTILVWLRRQIPAFRPEKFMEVAWVVLLPAVLVQDLIVAVIAVWRS
ncbi:NADH dehydrogenase family protein [Mycobacterium kansasii 732]|nr:NADH dehydrogenase family protein [Mycobacterium kansasii 732]